MKRNSMLQIRIDTVNIEKLQKMSVDDGLTLSEFCFIGNSVITFRIIPFP